ncbi:MAG: hypothetical protein WA906_06160 [Pacificimonas sp.]
MAVRDPNAMLARVDEKFDQLDRRARQELERLRATKEGRAAERRMEERERGPLREKIKTAAYAFVGLAVAALLYAIFIGPVGIDGFILLALALTAAVVAPFMLSGRKKPEPVPTVDTIINAELGALPVRVERWLAQRRADLPQAARVQVDELLLRLEVLAPQLQKVDADAPVVTDARRLIGNELPRLVTSYVEVPATYRGADSDADRNLVEGLATVSGELKRLSEQLAKGDLDRLAIEGRFLETKYRGDTAGSADPA